MTNETISSTPSYLVLADDGNQYGPITESDLRAWIKEGRVQGHNQAWLQGSPNWKPLSEHSAFRDSLPPPPPVATRPPIPPRPVSAVAENKTMPMGNIVGSYILCFIMPFLGFFAGIYLMAKKETGHGVACMALSVVMFFVYLSMLNS
jgi:hypothetical protein